MRRMTQLTPANTSVKMTSTFYGYNHNEIISNGEMYDMQNMADDLYPLLTPRVKRGITSWDTAGADPVPLTGIHGRDQLVHIRGTQVFYNFIQVEGLTVSADPLMLPKKIVSFGAYVLIFPDKKYFNTVHLSEYGSIDRLYSVAGGSVSATLSRSDGTAWNVPAGNVGPTAPASPANGDLWIDQSGDMDVLRQYSSATQEWIEITTTYIKLAATGIGDGLKQYDTIDLSGLECADTETSAKARSQIAALNANMIVYDCAADWIVVAGLLCKSQAALKANTVKADLKVPDLDFICESNNRLWGCKYGYENGKVVNELRASKLGDFRNWNCFMGLSTDSYSASVGTDGVFTGCAVQRGYPVFFKEACIHRVSGATPSSFSVTTTICRGVQSGSWRSVAVVNESIYYKSRTDVMMFDGSMPVSISAQLGNILYSDARAGELNGRYYISMKDKNNRWALFVYNTKTGTWHKEDGTRALGFGKVNDELFFIDEVDNTMVAVRGTTGAAEADFDWGAEFDLSDVSYIPSGNADTPMRVRNAGYISMFKIRMYLEPGAKMRLWIQYNDGPYQFMGERTGTDLRTFVLPVVPKRADHTRFKITGTGDCRIYSISRIAEVAGDGV